MQHNFMVANLKMKFTQLLRANNINYVYLLFLLVSMMTAIAGEISAC